MSKYPEPQPLVIPMQDVYDHLMRQMCAALPRPATDQPADRIRRENAAMAEVASMRPADAAEAELAVSAVVASEHAMDMLATIRHGTPDVLKDTAAATRMIRESLAMRSLLLRIQEARLKRQSGKTAFGRVKAAPAVAAPRISAPPVPAPAPNRQPAGWQAFGEADPGECADDGRPAKETRVLH